MMKTRMRTCQLVRVFFMSKVMLSGKIHMTSLQSEGEALASVGVAHPPRMRRWPGAAASAFKPCALDTFARLMRANMLRRAILQPKHALRKKQAHGRMAPQASCMEDRIRICPSPSPL
jgi:hypothetical protein